MLNDYTLAWDSTDAFEEFTWLFACDASDANAFGRQDIRISEILKGMELWGDSVRLGLGNMSYTAEQLKTITNHLAELNEQGIDVCHDPWPGPDLPLRAGYVWDNYSGQRLVERTTAVYSGALRIYQTIVATWFQPFANRLALYQLMPTQFTGWLVTSNEIARQGHEPILSWFRRALPSGEKDRVDFALARDFDDLRAKELFLYDDVRRAGGTHRPNAGHPYTFHTSTILSHVFDACPATKLAHK